MYVLGSVLHARDTYSSEMCLLWVRIVPSPRGLCVHIIQSSKEEKTRFHFFLDTLLDVFTAIVHNIYYIYIYKYTRTTTNNPESVKRIIYFIHINAYNLHASAWTKYILCYDRDL